MTITTEAGSGQSLLTPAEVQRLLVLPLTQSAVCTRVSTVISIGTNKTIFPRVVDDGDTAWTPQATPIEVDETSFDDIEVEPLKLAGLRAISNELIADSSDAAVAIVGDALVRSTTLRLDAAFFGDTTANGPDGLESLPDYQTIEYSGSIDDLDMFAEAIVRSESVGGQITSFVAHTNTVLDLMQLKDQVDSRRPLLGTDPTQPTRRAIYGVGLYPCDAVPEGDVWAIPGAKVYVVIRDNASVAADGSKFFDSDRTALRSTLRIGFAFIHQQAIVRIANVSS